MVLKCTGCTYITDCDYATLHVNGFGCVFDGYCEFQRPRTTDEIKLKDEIEQLEIKLSSAEASYEYCRDGYRQLKAEIERMDEALKVVKNLEGDEVAILRDAYLEAVSALREAVVEEETMLDDHGFLDPEHRAELQHQVERHSAILEKAPEEVKDAWKRV